MPESDAQSVGQNIAWRALPAAGHKVVYIYIYLFIFYLFFYFYFYFTHGVLVTL